MFQDERLAQGALTDPKASRRGAVLEEDDHNFPSEVKNESVTFPAHRFLWSARLARANKIKANFVNTTSDAEALNIRKASSALGKRLVMPQPSLRNDLCRRTKPVLPVFRVTS
jgi:hypothetical protein